MLLGSRVQFFVTVLGLDLGLDVVKGDRQRASDGGRESRTQEVAHESMVFVLASHPFNRLIRSHQQEGPRHIHNLKIIPM
jgi:hypothetical protein